MGELAKRSPKAQLPEMWHHVWDGLRVPVRGQIQEVLQLANMEHVIGIAKMAYENTTR